MRLYIACSKAGLLSGCIHRINQSFKTLGTGAEHLETGLPISCGQLALAYDLTRSSASGSTDLYHTAFDTYATPCDDIMASSRPIKRGKTQGVLANIVSATDQLPCIKCVLHWSGVAADQGIQSAMRGSRRNWL